MVYRCVPQLLSSVGVRGCVRTACLGFGLFPSLRVCLSRIHVHQEGIKLPFSILLLIARSTIPSSSALPCLVTVQVSLAIFSTSCSGVSRSVRRRRVRVRCGRLASKARGMELSRCMHCVGLIGGFCSKYPESGRWRTFWTGSSVRSGDKAATPRERMRPTSRNI